MHGDLSWAFRNRIDNLVAPLDQQGRVFTDRDGNARTALTLRWQDEAGRSAFGSRVAAVPASQPHGFELVAAELNSAGEVLIKVLPGLVWADGLLAYLVETPLAPGAPVQREARPLGPPFQGPLSPPLGTAGTRDAVVLELWREALNGFQQPEELIEPALGGPDTAQRLQTAMAFRLCRMAAGDTCDSVVSRLQDDLAARAKLTVSLQPTTTTNADCPELLGGGYSGFEHNLYRIEIAEVSSGASGAMFKWSQFNGGLVGRGSHTSATQKITLTANDQAILRSGLDQFYLEVIELDATAGFHRVVFGQRATLGSDGELQLASTSPILGSSPPSGTFFFRLWNDIRPVSDFPQASTQELMDGIRLQFDTVGGAPLVPGDYWTFPVRAGGIFNPPTLIDHQPPEGVLHHRVPLGVLRWSGSAPISAEVGQIDDCREVFQPLTEQAGCCTLRVGPHGDFATIQAAVNALPATGGRICVLPGDYTESVLIEGKHDVIIHGCGSQTRVHGAPNVGETFTPPAPVFHVLGSTEVRLETLVVIAAEGGIGVLLEERAFLQIDTGGPPQLLLEDVLLDELEVFAGSASAIEERGGRRVTIRNCTVHMRDIDTLWPAVTLLGEDLAVERNSIGVLLGDVALTVEMLPAHVHALGGLWLRGGCQRVRVIDNQIVGGLAHGIILGDVVPINWDGGERPPWGHGSDDPCLACLPGDTTVPDPDGETGTTWVAGPPLEEILIERNRIFGMGIFGIGVYGFFPSDKQGIISVRRLTILGNHIRACLWRTLARTPDEMQKRMGYGGIALADVEELIAHDNVIEENGPDHLQPICGVYVFHGAGVELSRCRILDNGHKTDKPALQPSPGARGGIYLQLATAPVFEGKSLPSTRGVPALRVHDCVVTQPLGPALVVSALGPVSIEGNALTSRGIVPSSQGFNGATVLIADLGIAPELLAAMPSFGALGISGANPSVLPAAAAPVPQLLAGGPVLFNANQVHLEQFEPLRTPTLASVMIVTLDDLSFGDNQCRCTLGRSMLAVDVLLLGFTARANDNRLQELPNSTQLSGMIVGWHVTATDNHATHCLRVAGVINKVDVHNTITYSTGCERFAAVLTHLR